MKNLVYLFILSLGFLFSGELAAQTDPLKKNMNEKQWNKSADTEKSMADAEKEAKKAEQESRKAQKEAEKRSQKSPKRG